MLAPSPTPHLSAAALDIQPWELEGLLAFVRHARAGALPPENFSISISGTEGECGTIACVGGWVWELGLQRRKRADYYSDMQGYVNSYSCPSSQHQLHVLYWNYAIAYARLGRKPNALDAAAVVEGYLSTGRVTWA